MVSADISDWGAYVSRSHAEAVVEGYFPFRIHSFATEVVFVTSHEMDFFRDILRVEVGDEIFEIAYDREDILAYSSEEFYNHLYAKLVYVIRHRKGVDPENHITLGEN